MKHLITVDNYNVMQLTLPLDFIFYFEKDIAHDDVSRTVFKVAKEVNINKYYPLSNTNAHGYDGVMMFKLVILSRTLLVEFLLMNLKGCAEIISDLYLLHRETSHLLYRFIDSLRKILK